MLSPLMTVKSVFIFIYFTAIAMAQPNSKESHLYQDYKFEKDSLILFGGVNANEYNLVNIKKENQYSYFRNVFTISENGDYSKTYHWSVPIKIFLDKKIDTDIREDFKQFIKFFPEINHLSISIVNNKKEANYFIYQTNEIIDYSESAYYKGIIYSLLPDQANKFYGGRLYFNPKQLNNSAAIKRKLRQFFFASLGNFFLRDVSGNNSLLSEDYVSTVLLSDYDSFFLKTHYGLYNLNPIDYRELKKLLQKIQTTTFTNFNGYYTLKI